VIDTMLLLVKDTNYPYTGTQVSLSSSYDLEVSVESTMTHTEFYVVAKNFGN